LAEESLRTPRELSAVFKRSWTRPPTGRIGLADLQIHFRNSTVNGRRRSPQQPGLRNPAPTARRSTTIRYGRSSRPKRLNRRRRQPTPSGGSSEAETPTRCPTIRPSIQKASGSSTSLGRFKDWSGPEGDKYSSQEYTDGQGCWNGPNRSTKVRIVCGPKTELLSASEPRPLRVQHGAGHACGLSRHPTAETVDPEHDELQNGEDCGKFLQRRLLGCACSGLRIRGLRLPGRPITAPGISGIFEHGNTPQFVLRKFAAGFENSAGGPRGGGGRGSSRCRTVASSPRFFLDCPGWPDPADSPPGASGRRCAQPTPACWPHVWSPQRTLGRDAHICCCSPCDRRIRHSAAGPSRTRKSFCAASWDQLHEELKRPLLLPPVGEEDDDGGGNSGDGGGGDANSDGGASAGVADGADSTAAGAASAPGAQRRRWRPLLRRTLWVSSTEASAIGRRSRATTVERLRERRSGLCRGQGEGAVKRRFNSIISRHIQGQSGVNPFNGNSCGESVVNGLKSFKTCRCQFPWLSSWARQPQTNPRRGGGSRVSRASSFLVVDLVSDLATVLDAAQVSLQDCLDAFLLQRRSKGDNMYHCAKCGNCERHQILAASAGLPEMLTVHLNSTGLPGAQTVYDLTAVVCHHGSTSGGHYNRVRAHSTTPACSGTSFDDARVRPVDVSAVEKRDEWMQPMRVKVSEIMETEGDSSSLMPFYISRSWAKQIQHIRRSRPNQQRRLPVPAPPAVAARGDYPEDVFGGGATVNRLGPCPECAGDLERTRDRAPPGAGHADQGAAAFPAGSGPGRAVLHQHALVPQVSGRMWRYFLSIYGGGPEVKIEGSSSQQRRSRSSSKQQRSQQRRQRKRRQRLKARLQRERKRDRTAAPMPAPELRRLDATKIENFDY
uniref:ubiquitinyl hydrolase 1 n=1 Tax=Macrostomum lignano TaxID=282301 RepID=A0A1I8FJY8_9PLAT